MTTLHNDAIIEMESAIRSLPGQYELIGGGTAGALRDAARQWIECGFTPATAQPWWDAGCFDAETAESARDLEILPSALAEDYPDPGGRYSSPVSWGYAISNGDCGFLDWGETADDTIVLINEDTVGHTIHHGPAAAILYGGKADPALIAAVREVVNGADDVTGHDAEGCSFRVTRQDT